MENLWLPLDIKNIKYKKHQNDMNTHSSHIGVKLGAKQLNIFRIGCKTTQSLKKINLKSHHQTFHLKNDSDSDKN
jgi:hypothetical protein